MHNACASHLQSPFADRERVALLSELPLDLRMMKKPGLGVDVPHHGGRVEGGSPQRGIERGAPCRIAGECRDERVAGPAVPATSTRLGGAWTISPWLAA